MNPNIAALSAALMSAVGGNDEAQETTDWLDTGYKPLNEILSGNPNHGIPYGRIVEIFGPSSSGKTALATTLMVSAQKAGGVAMFNDHENTFDVGLAKGMGLTDEFPFWIYKRPETWEQSNTLAMKGAEAIRKSKAISENAPIIQVFDSVAAMIPKSVFEKGIDELTMNDTTALSRVSSTTLKSVNQVTSKLNVCMVYLNQIRTKPGVVYGDPTTTPGGVAMEFYATTRLSLSRKRVMDADKEMTGQIITIKTVKNKASRPFQSVELRMKFLEDGTAVFDYTTSMLEVVLERKLLQATTQRVTWLDGKQYFNKALVEKIDTEGLYSQLEALAYPPA